MRESSGLLCIYESELSVVIILMEVGPMLAASCWVLMSNYTEARHDGEGCPAALPALCSATLLHPCLIMRLPVKRISWPMTNKK